MGCMAKKIPLSQGEYAIVDEEDYEWLMQWKWSLRESGNNKYAIRSEYLGRVGEKKKSKMIRMHRAILDAPDNVLVDHIDHNGLNNTRDNLRLCDSSQNVRNRQKINFETSSKYKGVYKSNSDNWVAAIDVDFKRIYLGSFITEESAAMAYNEAAIKHHKEFSHLNEVDVPNWTDYLSTNSQSSKFRGVSFDKWYSKWRVSIYPNNKHVTIGYFDNEIEAALAYNEAAVKHYGDKAKLNVTY